MALEAEIAYVANLARVLNVPAAEVTRYLLFKPFSDPNRSTYFLDLAQILKLLPPPPARVLDLGCGSGWTSEFLARSGYEVLGLDIAPDMIDIARQRISNGVTMAFEVANFGRELGFGKFDAVVLYDALHHAQDARAVVVQASRSLKEDGLFISIEPGRGHAAAEPTRDVVVKFGTTERDMPFEYQAALLYDAGFSRVRQVLRLSQLFLEDVATADGASQQLTRFQALLSATHQGLTSIVVAHKGRCSDGADPVDRRGFDRSL